MKARTKEELDFIRKSGQISAVALKKGLSKAEIGANLLDIERVVREAIEEGGADPAFMTVEGYEWATCLCLNDEVVHGVPRDIILKEGDLFTIDTGARYKGWCTDTAWTIKVGGGTNKLLSVGEEAMWAGIKQARAGNRVGDISAEMQRVIEKENGFCVVRSLVGHGIGKKLHEDPQIPGYGRKGTGPLLVEGMTVAIEAIYSESSMDVKMASDDWTYLTEDGSMAGMFEMSVIVGATGPEVLTDWRKA